MSVPEYFIGTVAVWLAVEDTARPADPATPPAAAWVPLGNNRLPDGEGVTWEVPQTINPERDLNDIFASDAFRVEADQMIGFSLKDFRAETISKALNDATVGTSTKAASVSVSAMGVAVAKHALLVRVNDSPYPLAAAGDDPYVSEFWGPSCYEMSNFTTALGSRAVSLVPFQFMSLLSMATANVLDRMGSWRFQNA